MKLKFRKYNRKYYHKCSDIMKETWDLNKYFHHIKDSNICYNAFLEVALINSDYTDIIVDRNDNVLGYLIASNKKRSTLWTKIKRFFLQLIFYIKQSYYLLTGRYGDKKAAIELFEKLDGLTNLLEKDKHKFDSEINLFFISSEIRGKGYGKKLMDRYIKYCRKEKIKKIFLWTDRGCNYKFYDNYGFELYDSINHELLEEPEEEYNGFVYSMVVE